jgi:hypothetical protein
LVSIGLGPFWELDRHTSKPKRKAPFTSSTRRQVTNHQLRRQDGGNVSLKAGGTINNTGRIQADGGKSAKFMHLDPLKTEGGKAGDITLTAQHIINSGVIRGIGGASDIGKGGNGSNVTLSANPEGNGVIVTFGGTGTPNGSLGTITSPNPSQSTNTLIGVWKKQ